MKICIVNPSRCGSTAYLYHLSKSLPNYKVVYEIITHEDGVELLKQKEDIVFKYQYLFIHKPLIGADKYIIIDRKDLDGWAYSSFMSFVNHHHHGKLFKDNYKFDKDAYSRYKTNLIRMYNESWTKERNRLLSQGAEIYWYEDMSEIVTEDVYHNGVKLEPVWSTHRLDN